MQHRLCIAKDCNIRPTFGLYMTDVYCKEHAGGNIINYLDTIDENAENKLCGIYRCKNIAEYNFNNCEPTFCETHMIKNLDLYKENILRAHKTPRDCTYKNCNSSLDNKKAIVSYKRIHIDAGSKEDKKCTGLFCKECHNIIKNHMKEKTMIKMNTQTIALKCLEKNCKNVRQFGTSSSQMPAICKECYEKSNKIVFSTGNKNKICSFDGCNVRASFNYDGEPAKYCVEHKEEEMINTDAKKCEEYNCNIQPVFGYTGEYAIRCVKHKLENMIDVRSRMCDLDDCNIRACYQNEDKTIVRCGQHREEEMKFMYKSLFCQEAECKKFASFGFAGKKPTKCFEHIEEFMLNLTNNKCSAEECDILASYGYEEKRTRERCSKHKLDDMVDLTLIMCSECKCTNMNKKYKPYCFRCFAKLNPDYESVIEYKTRENAFTLKLKERYSDAILDKKISGGISAHRPDFLLNLNDYAIIVEVDEGQHARQDIYCLESEDYRTKCLMTSLDKPIIMIRINPDNYRVNDRLIKGCFYYDERKLKVDDLEYNNRLSKLIEVVDSYVDNYLESEDFKLLKINRMKVIYLFYSN